MSSGVQRQDSRLTFLVIGASLAAIVGASAVVVAQSRREFTVVAFKYGFRVSGSAAPEIHVMKDDLVHITFSTQDIPHSFTIEAPYRIMRRAEPNKPVSFDFRADTTGRFPFFCSLTLDAKCKEMRGLLIVDPVK